MNFFGVKIFEEILLSSLTSLYNHARLAIGCGGCFPWEQRSSLEAVSRSVVCLLDLISLIVFLRFFLSVSPFFSPLPFISDSTRSQYIDLYYIVSLLCLHVMDIDRVNGRKDGATSTPRERCLISRYIYIYFKYVLCADQV